MSKEAVETVIGKAVSDAEFRNLLLADPNQALAGFDLTGAEIAALKRMDAESLENLGNTLETHRRNPVDQASWKISNKGESKLKNLSKRNKIILSAAGLILALAVVVAAVISLPGGSGLLGAGVRTITPTDPSIHIGQTVDLVVDAVYNCKWTSSDTNIVSFVSSTNDTKTVTVQANALGRATITAQCAGLTKGTTLVSVPEPITPDGAKIYGINSYNEPHSVTLSTGNESTHWTWTCEHEDVAHFYPIAVGGPQSYWDGSSIEVHADGDPYEGSCAITATTELYGSDTVTVTVSDEGWLR